MSETEQTNPEQPARILVVDDHPDNVEIINVRLSSRGFVIETATNGEEALQKVRENPPHLILLDVMMPLMDGYEVSRRIKNDPALPFIPIILVTARDSTQDKVDGLDAGADDYLTKPVNFRSWKRGSARCCGSSGFRTSSTRRTGSSSSPTNGCASSPSPTA